MGSRENGTNPEALRAKERESRELSENVASRMDAAVNRMESLLNKLEDLLAEEAEVIDE